MQSPGLYLPALASLLEEQTTSGSSEDLKHKGMCSPGAQRKQRIREINWGSSKKNLFIWPNLNILVKEGFYVEKMVYRAERDQG